MIKKENYLFANDNLIFREPPKITKISVRINKQIQQNCGVQKSIYRNQPHFYALTMKLSKKKIKKQSHLQLCQRGK